MSNDPATTSSRPGPEPDQVPQAPQRGAYLLRNPVFNAILRVVDGLLAVITAWRRPLRPPPVRRILIANGAHLGDIVVTTAILPAIKSAFPDASIGLLVGSWSLPIVKDHPLVDRVHLVDHWLLNRASISRLEKFKRYWRSRSLALREIREIGYDVALDLYFYVPNSIPLLWQTGIPVRIGYNSAGFGPLLTRRLDVNMWHNARSMLDFHLSLVSQIPGIGRLDSRLLRPSVRRQQIDVTAFAGGGAYTVLHMGSGAAIKDWPESSWVQLAQQLQAQGHRLVLTGAGPRERQKVDRFMQQVGGATNLCDSLSWQQFVEVVSEAQLIVTSDSVAVHVATAAQIPTVVIGHGMMNPVLWRPANPKAQVLMHPMPCIPCYRTAGCATMACLRSVAPETVGSAVLRQVPPSPSSQTASVL